MTRSPNAQIRPPQADGTGAAAAEVLEVLQTHWRMRSLRRRQLGELPLQRSRAQCKR